MPNSHQALKDHNLVGPASSPAPPTGAQTPQIAISTLSLGTLPSALHDQLKLLQQLQAAGANALEVCRTSLPTGFRNFDGLGKACQTSNLHVIYNADDTLWNAGYLSASLTTRVAEAHSLGAHAIKFSLGHYPGIKHASWPQLLKDLNAASAPLVMIENDRSLGGGSLCPLQNCLEDAEALGYPLHMSFDIANWRWCGVDPTRAAKRLSKFVRQIDCKGVRQVDGRLYISTPTAFERHQWHDLLLEFKHLSTLTIEYPLIGTAEQQEPAQTGASRFIERVSEHIQHLRALPLQTGLQRAE